MLENLRNLLLPSRRAEDGASAVEYGLLIAGIAALIVAVVFILGGVIKKSFNDTCSTIVNKAASTAECTAPAVTTP